MCYSILPYLQGQEEHEGQEVVEGEVQQEEGVWSEVQEEGVWSELRGVCPLDTLHHPGNQDHPDRPPQPEYCLHVGCAGSLLLGSITGLIPVRHVR